MTMTEIRKEFNERLRFNGLMFPKELWDWTADMLRQIEELWKFGYIENPTPGFMKSANGYQIRSCDYDSIHICQTYGLNSISATKAATKELAAFILGI